MHSATPKPRVTDGDVRTTVVSERDRSFLVQAPAGSGKTELLIQRFLNLLADPAVEEPEAVLAITFTRKAAAEMRGRVLASLERAHAGHRPESEHERRTLELAGSVFRRDAERKWNLLASPSRIEIRTFDSLAEQIVQSAPLRGGFGARLGIEERADGAYREAARRTVLRLGGENRELSDALACLLRDADAQPATLESLLAGILEKRDQWMSLVRPEGGPPQSRDALERALAAAVSYELSQVREAFVAALGEDLNEIVRLAAFAAERADDDKPLAALRGVKSLPGVAPDDLPKWRGLKQFCFKTDGDLREKFDKGVGLPAGDPLVQARRTRAVELFASLASRPMPAIQDAAERLAKLPPVKYTAGEWGRLEALLTVLPVLAAELDDVFAKRGATDFVAVSLAAVDVLKQRGAGASRWSRLRHLLVDEFQDTSVKQVELLKALTAEWQPNDGRTLFLVGDPMQSIYAFRKAEVTLFERAAKPGSTLLPVQCEPRRLKVNFRSQAGLVDWFNCAFQDVMRSENEITGAVPYAGADAIHPPAEPAVQVRSFEAKDLAAEAEFIAASIESELAENSDPQFRVAVLVRGRPHLSQIVPALHARGIGFRASEIDPLAGRPAVRDLVALARAITHLGDRTAWLAVLRAPWCGLKLHDLATLAGDKEAQDAALLDLLRARYQRLSADAQARLARVLPLLEGAIANRGRTRLRALVEHTWHALGGPAAVRPEARGDADRRDAAAFLDLLDDIEIGGDLPDDETLEPALKDLRAPADTAANIRVELITIHKAKGLEFDSVYVPGLGRKPRGDDRSPLYWRELVLGDSPQLLLAPFDAVNKPRSEEKTIASYIRLVQREAAREESKRLLYVACTRAKQRLTLTWNRPELNKDGTPVIARESLLNLIYGIPALDGEREGPPAPSRNAGAPVLFRRLADRWAPPRIEAAVPFMPRPRHEPEHTFDWVGQKQRAIGTVTHRFLQQIGREGLDKWGARRVESCAKAIRAALISEGVNLGEADSAAATVRSGLLAVLAHEKGRWILMAREGGACEYALTGRDGDHEVSVKLDRTFVENGERWVVDYKMATATTTSLEAFIAQQVEKYRADLKRYARIIAQRDPLPIRMALYFPLLGEFREVGQNEDSSSGPRV